MPVKKKKVESKPDTEQRFNAIDTELEQVWGVINSIIDKIQELEPTIERMAKRMGVE